MKPYVSNMKSENMLFGTLILGSVLMISVLVTQIAVQITLLIILLLVACITGSRDRLLLLAAASVPFVAFVRRIAAGTQAHVDFDPLILFPFILVVLVIAVSIGRRSDMTLRTKSENTRRWLIWGVIAFTMGVTVSLVLHRAIKPDVLFFATALILPIVLAALIAVGVVPDTWPIFEKGLPLLGLVVGIYGVIQFVFLPEWDKSWMISSKLQSIGQPEPLAVRVFGMSESPGPYAAFVGLALIICVNNALKSKALPQLSWFAFAAFLVFPLLLSGVRSALVSLLICAAAATIIRGRGMGRVVPVFFFAAIGFGIDRLVTVFGSNSTILTADRYTTFDPSQDDSLQARLKLLEYLVNPWPHVLGNPGAAPVDNLVIDVLRAYGFLPFILMILIVLIMGWSSFRLLASNSTSSAGLSALYVLILGASGNLFLSSFGILMGIIFGSAAKGILDLNERESWAKQSPLARRIP